MKFVLFVVLALLAAVALSLGAIQEPGYVLIGYGGWSVETTLSMLIIALLLTFVVSYYAIRLLVGLFNVPRATGEWNRRRKSERARKGLNQGLLKLAGGDWYGAEKLLLKQITDSDNPMVNYLAAARAAQKLGAPERRDRYLLAAHESSPKHEIAVGLTQAELQISHHQLEQGLATLRRLRKLAPRNRNVLEMLMRLYMQLEDWNSLRDLLPELRKRKIVDGKSYHDLESDVYLELMNHAAQTGLLLEVKNIWGSVPRRLNREPDLQLCYAEHLQHLGASDEAEKLVRKSVKRNWNAKLVSFYGQLESADNAKQLANAERWLRNHEQDPDLLSSLGRLAARNQLWGKARGYLESSIGISPSVEGYQLLANLLEQKGEQVEAAECYRKATMLAAQSIVSSYGAVMPAVSQEKDNDDAPALDAPDSETEETEK